MPPQIDFNCLSYWFPKVEQTGIPVPPTQIVKTEVDLSHLLDGQTPEGWDAFIDSMARAVANIGTPCFIRTGHGSGKHDWKRTCYLPPGGSLESHIAALVEWSHSVDLIGLPTNVWAVRQMIRTKPLFYAFAGMPITTEYRWRSHTHAAVLAGGLNRRRKRSELEDDPPGGATDQPHRG